MPGVVICALELQTPPQVRLEGQGPPGGAQGCGRGGCIGDQTKPKNTGAEPQQDTETKHPHLCSLRGGFC